MKIPLSVTVITFNEELNIRRCLDSVKDIADDIVVVDSYSSDETVEICRELGVQFVSHVFEGHIQQKNFAVGQAKFPHILSLDADEALSDTLRDNIKIVLENWIADGYTMNRLNNYCGKWIRHAGWYPDRKLRLWDSRKGKWTGQNPHDRFELEKDSRIGHIRGDILHYSYPSISQHIEQINKFSTISASGKFEKGKKIPLFVTILRTWFTFIKKFILKLGFLDGYYGYIISRLSACGVFLKDIKLREMHRNNQHTKAE